MEACAKPEEMNRYLRILFSIAPMLQPILNALQLPHSTLIFVSTGKLITIKMLTLWKSDQSI